MTKYAVMCNNKYEKEWILCFKSKAFHLDVYGSTHYCDAIKEILNKVEFNSISECKQAIQKSDELRFKNKFPDWNYKIVKIKINKEYTY